ncbi:hypothetical protein C0580_05095 [Candidatus Parcubacteria bacterium]|nr:MAG: hypothetical protein C0580_05095 [Candidatus Parcubacteria bacterium]
MATRTTKKNKVYIRIVTFFLILTILAIFIVLHFALAKVTIKVESSTENIDKNVLVEMVPENSGEISEEKILGKIINTEFELNAEVESSKQMVPSEKAGGYVTIYNNYSKDQVLVATTRLLTPDEKLFRIADRVEIPIGGQARVWAEADEAGEDFVIGPSKFTIPGLWKGVQEYIYAETETGMTMETQPQYVVTQENINEAQNKILAQAKIQALENINEELQDTLKINEDRLLVETETLKVSELGSRSDKTSLTQKINAYGLVFTEDDLIKVAQQKFTKELESNQSLIEFLNDQFEYQIIETDLETGKAVVEIKIAAKVSSNKHFWEIDKEDLFGLTEQQIREKLQNMNVENAEIKFFPVWLKNAPSMKDHIIIE